MDLGNSTKRFKNNDGSVRGKDSSNANDDSDDYIILK